MKVTMLRWKLFWRKRGKVGNDTFFYMIFCLNMLVCFSAEMCQYSCLDNGVCEVLYTGPPRYVRKCIARDYKGWLVSRPIWVSAYLTVLRDRTRYRIGWIFEKNPNSLWPFPPSSFRKIILQYFYRKRLKKASYTGPKSDFWIENAPPPLWNLSENSSDLVAWPVPKTWQHFN